MDYEKKLQLQQLHNNGNSNTNENPSKARVLFSARLTLAIICMLATMNFMLQRLTINFGLVCMVKTPVGVGTGGGSSELNSFTVQVLNITEDDDPGDRIINASVVQISQMFPTESTNCILSKANSSGNNSSRFDIGEFEWPREVQGAILSAFYYGFAFAQIPGGWCSDRFGAKRGLILSGLFLSLLSLLTPVAAYLGAEYLIALRLVMGIVNGASMPAISTLSSRWFADVERGFMVAVAYSGFGIATAITYPISAFFCEFTGWPYLFYFGGALGLVWCVMTYFLIYDWPENHPRISMKELDFIQKHRAVQYGGTKRQRMKIPYFQMFTSLPVWALLVANFCCFWLFLTMSMYLPTYLKEVLYLDISENGLLSALPFVGMMSCHFLVAIAFDRLRHKNYFKLTTLRKIFNTFGTLAAAISMVAIGFISCDNVLGAVFMITLGQMFIEFAFMGGYIFSIFELAPKFAGSLTAVMNTFGLVVGLFSPALVSHLTPNGSRDEWLLVFYISAALSAFGGIFYLIFGSSELQAWADVPPSASESNYKIEQEMKVLQIKLINGDSNINGEFVKS